MTENEKKIDGSKSGISIPGPYPLLNHVGECCIWLCFVYLHVYSKPMLNGYGGLQGRATLRTMLGLVDVDLVKHNETPSEDLVVPAYEVCLDNARRGWDVIRGLFSMVLGDRDAFDPDLFKVFPIASICKLFSLSDMELDFLLMTVVSQHDDTYARAFSFADGNQSGTPRPSLIFILKMLAFLGYDRDALMSMVSEVAPLRRYELIKLGRNPANGLDETSMNFAPVYVPNRVYCSVLGHSPLYPPDACEVITAEDIPEMVFDPTPFDAESVSKLATRSRLVILGTGGLASKASILRVARSFGLSVLSLNLNAFFDLMVGQSDRVLCERLTIVVREARLTCSMLVLSANDCTQDASKWLMTKAQIFVKQLVRESDLKVCVTFPHLTSEARWMFNDYPELVYPKPTLQEQPKLWTRALSRYLDDDAAKHIAPLMSAYHALSYEEILETIGQTLSRMSSLTVERALSHEHLTDTINRGKTVGLAGVACLRRVGLGLDDIVLAEDTVKILKQAMRFATRGAVVRDEWGMAQIDTSGGGMGILFTGDPGTGKTLTALVLGHELERPVYQVDLSQIVDKHIGETEKRLKIVFDTSAQSRAILLFDEADAIFGKRTAVRSSNDRYANLEVNYVLQLIEAYTGVTILTSNFASAFDDALMRRLQFKVNFPKPTEAERIRLWRHMIPPNAPRAKDLRFRMYGRAFANMTGGHIKNAVFQACVDVPDHGVLNHQILWAAAIDEYRAMGSVVRDAEYEEDYHWDDADEEEEQ